MDGGSLRPAALSWAAPGLLFDEHVGRPRALGGRRVGPDARQISRRRCDRGRCHGDAERRAGTVRSKRRRARTERALGRDGRAMDGMESLARHAGFDMALVSSHPHDHRHLPDLSLAGRALSYFQAT